MTKISKTFYVFVFIVLFSFLTFASSLPEWISTPVFKKGNDIYYVGMGVDKDKVVARNKAIEDIKSKVVESILVEITSDVRREMLITSEEEGTEVVNKLTSEVSTKGRARIFVPAPESEHSFQDQHGNYVVYLLVKYPENKIKEERARIEQIYKDMIRSVDKFLEEGDSYAKEGKLINAVISYIIAARNAINVEERKMNYPEIIKKIDDILSRTSIEVLDGNNKVVNIGSSGEVKFIVFYNSEGKKIPVKDANLTFRITEGGADINYFSTTDQNGIAICTVNKVIRFENKKLSITAFLNIDFGGLATINQDTKRDASKLIGKLRTIKAEATWYMNTEKAKKATILVFLEKDEKYSLDSKLSSSLSSYVMKKGYKVSTVPKLPKKDLNPSHEDISNLVKDSTVILVKISEPSEKEIEFGQEKIKRITSLVTIEIYDENGNLLNSESFEIKASSKENFSSNLPKNIGKKIEEITF